MKETKAKAFIICVLSFAIMLFMGSSVRADDGDYEVSYEKDGNGVCYVVLEFQEEVSPTVASSEKYEIVGGNTLRIRENIRNNQATFARYKDVPILMASGSTVNVSYVPPIEIELDCTTVKVPAGIYENATSGNEEILVIDETGTITPIKAGTTTITAQTGSGDSVTWNVEIIGEDDDDSEGDTDTTGTQGENGNTNNQGNTSVADNNLKYELIKPYEDKYIGYRVQFSDLEEKEKSSYYLWISNSEEDMLSENASNIENFDSASEHAISVNDGKSANIDRFLARKGDIYFQIVERYVPTGATKAVYKVIYKKTKLERPTYKLGTTNKLYFFDERTSTYMWTPEDYPKTDRKLNVKIGKIGDVSILRAIKNSESGCLEKLLEYAKSATPIYEATITEGDSETITDKFNVVDKEYYFVYTQLENSDGKLYNVEDIGLYQGLVGETVGANLFSYLDSNFVWNIPEETAEGEAKNEEDYSGKNKEKIAPDLGPQAGGTLLGMALVIVIGGVSYIIYRKYNGINVK